MASVAKGCSVEGCARPFKGRGLCNLHLTRFRKNGEVGPVGHIGPKGRKCSVEGCGDKHHSNGFCAVHSYRAKQHGDPNKVLVRSDLPALDRFWAKVDKSGECWEWLGAKSGEGYGNFTTHHKGKTYKAHRLSYQLMNGYIPEGLVIDHICHNTSCVNPSHLRAVTRKQNGEHRLGARSDSSTGYLGVQVDKKTGMFLASVTHHGRSYTRRGFPTADAADAAARVMRIELFTHNDRDRQKGLPVPLALEYKDEWKEAFFDTISTLADDVESFTCDDLKTRLPEPGHPSWWGSAFRSAAARKLIRPVGYEQSRARSRRGGVLRRWAVVTDARR